MKKQPIKFIFIPGNGGSTVNDHWFPYVRERLRELHFEVVSKNFPDPVFARQKYWLPFLKDELGANKNTVLIGHSSGAVASMRYAESHEIYGSILISPCWTDLNDYHEKMSGYFEKSWDWNKIKENQNWIVQFASLDDPYIPIQEARFIHDSLRSEYFEYDKHGHFGEDVFKKDFPEIITIIKRKFNLE